MIYLLTLANNYRCFSYSGGVVFTQEVIKGNMYQNYVQFKEFLRKSVSSFGGK